MSKPATAKQLAFCQRLWDEGRAPYAFSAVNRCEMTTAGASAYIDQFKNCPRSRRAPETTTHTFRRPDGSVGTWTEY